MTGRRLAFVINSLEGGGAERVFAALVEAMAVRFADDEVHVLLLDKAEERYRLPNSVARHDLDCRGGLLRSVRRTASTFGDVQPHVAISFLTRANCATILGARRRETPVLISERVNTTSHFGSGLGGVVQRRVVRALYPKAAGVIAPSAGIADELTARYGVSSQQVRVIHNPCDIAAVRAAGAAEAEMPLPADFAVAVGRLMPNKNFALLIRAFAAAGAPANLVILGEGPERPRLEALAAELGVAERVHMPGFLANPHAVVERAAFFVSASNAEGFPNALAEAMALGKPVISTDCPSGPAEILAETPGMRVDGLFEAAHGLLTPTDAEAPLCEGLRSLADPAARAPWGERAAARIAAFGPDAFADAFESAIRRALDS